MYNVYVTKVKNIRPAENADRLNLCEVFGNTTVIDKSVNETDLYIYFPVDGQISVEFGEANNLFRKKDENGNQIGGFIDPDKRNITAIRLRGNKSDGLILPLSALASFGDISTLKEGDIVSVFNGHQIAQKYIPKSTGRGGSSNGMAGNRTRKKKVPIAPLFAEHADTEQLAYNLSAFKPGDEIEITLKMHGTSGRTGYLPTLKGYKDNIFRRAINKVRMGLKVRKNWGSNGCNALYHSLKHGEPIYDYGYVSGTRRVVLDTYEGGFYGDNQFREQHSKIFEGKLMKGETAYYEIVSFTNDGTPIMGMCKVPSDAKQQYGETMLFHYGRQEGSDIYVYRMTMTNEDGFVVEYTPDFMRYRCEQMGIKTVPVMWKGIIPNSDIPEGVPYCPTGNEPQFSAGEWIKNKAEEYYDGPDPIGKTHVREGVVVRILNRPKFTAYKHKNFLFKQITGIIKDKVADSNAVISEDILSEM
jgi:hypothetical protein